MATKKTKVTGVVKVNLSQAEIDYIVNNSHKLSLDEVAAGVNRKPKEIQSLYNQNRTPPKVDLFDRPVPGVTIMTGAASKEGDDTRITETAPNVLSKYRNDIHVHKPK